MRAHCVNFYDENDEHIGDLWISAPDGRCYLDASDLVEVDGTARVKLGPSQARQIRDALDTFLAETE